MDPENVLKLQKCREEMVTSLEFDLMSPCLIQFNILSTEEYDKIKMRMGNSDKISTFLDVLQSKDNHTYNKFLKYLEEDYDWVAWSVKNTQISSAQLSEYASSRAATPETATMSSGERERGGHEFRERERLPGPDTDRMSTSGYGSYAGDTSLPRGLCSPVHSSEFSLRSSHSD